MKQTAVEWLREQIILNSKLRETKTGKISFTIDLSMLDKVIKQAKEMEKKKKIEFACQVAEASAEKYIQGKTTEQIAKELLTFKSE